MPPRTTLPGIDELLIPAYLAKDGESSPALEQWKRDHPDWFEAGRWTSTPQQSITPEVDEQD